MLRRLPHRRRLRPAIGQHPVDERARTQIRADRARAPLPRRAPTQGVAQDRGWRITDRYIENTRLRLRRMEPLGDGETVFKLGQKEVPRRRSATPDRRTSSSHPSTSEIPETLRLAR